MFLTLPDDGVSYKKNSWMRWSVPWQHYTKYERSPLLIMFGIQVPAILTVSLRICLSVTGSNSMLNNLATSLLVIASSMGPKRGQMSHG